MGKLFRVFIFFMTIFLLFSASAYSDVTIKSTLEIIPNVPSYNGGNATEVDYWHFSVDTAGKITIDILSYRYDFDNDGDSVFIDSVIYLFSDDGALHYIASNDDSDSTFGDGSLFNFDSYLSIYLSKGNYTLAISDWELYLEDAVGGINRYGFSPIAFDRMYYTNSDGFNIPYGDYQITFIGDVTVQQDQAPVPEPVPKSDDDDFPWEIYYPAFIKQKK